MPCHSTNQPRRSRFTEMFDRETFLEDQLKSVKPTHLRAYRHKTYDSSGQPVCQLCQAKVLSNLTYTLEPAFGGGSYERAVRLPCGHIFGEECVRAHFDLINMTDLYNDDCPQCGARLYEQDDADTRRAKIALFEDQIRQEKRYRMMSDLVVGPATVVLTVAVLAAVWLPMFGYGLLFSLVVGVAGIVVFAIANGTVVLLFFPKHRALPQRAEDGTPLLGDRFI